MFQFHGHLLLAVVVFWIAHFLSNVVTHLSETPEGSPRFMESSKDALSHSSGLLLAAIIPLTIALFGVLDLVDDDTAVWVALWVDVSLLALFGFLSS